MTPREFGVYARVYNEKMEFEQEQRQREIYASALLISSFVWAKGKKPDYKKVFKQRKGKEEMSDAEMLKMAESLNAKFGGTDLRKEVH